jgi:hypothetical protein
MPPNGSRGSDFTMPFTNTAPARISRASASPFAASRVQTLAPRPKRVRFASRTASAASRATVMGASGPNVSSSNAAMPGVTFPSTVGA